MLQQQVYVINTVLMVIDALCVIIAGYLSYYIKLYVSDGALYMENSVFIGSVLFVMFLNNYFMGRFRLYGETKPSSIIVMLWSISQVFGDCVCIFLCRCFSLQGSELFPGIFALVRHHQFCFDCDLPAVVSNLFYCVNQKRVEQAQHFGGGGCRAGETGHVICCIRKSVTDIAS